MKILFFIESLRTGGKERRLVELLKILSQNNQYNIELVITMKQIDYTEIHDLPIKIRIIERRAIKKDPRLFFKFYSIAKSFKPDLIHVWGNMVAIYAIPAKVMLGVPLINNQITDAPDKVPGGLLSHKLPFLFSDLIIANSQAGLISYNSPEDKSAVIYNGFSQQRLENLKPKEEKCGKFGITTQFIVGMVATFSKLKDYATYIKAANLILENNKNVTFLCVGAGNDTQFREMVKPSNKNNIIFTGRQDDVESIMNACDIGVLSTFREGISNSIMEFMALGKPVIATGGGGTEELIINNESGYIIKSGDPQLLAEKIEYLLANPKERKAIGDSAKKRISTHFSIDKMTDSFISVYQSFERKKERH